MFVGDDDADAKDKLLVEMTRIDGSQQCLVSFKHGVDDPKWYSFDSEVIERVARIIELRRNADHDHRSVCPDHGYHRSTYTKGSGETCPRCEEVRLAKDAQARLSAGSVI